MNNIITFDKVSKSFGELKVLDQLNLKDSSFAFLNVVSGLLR